MAASGTTSRVDFPAASFDMIQRGDRYFLARDDVQEWLRHLAAICAAAGEENADIVLRSAADYLGGVVKRHGR